MNCYRFCFDIFIVLITAHFISDFVLQNKWLIEKKKSEWGVFLHSLIHALITWLLFWQWKVGGIILAVFLVHFIVDQHKIKLSSKYGNNIWIFLGDQLFHILTLWAIVEINSFAVYTKPCLFSQPLKCTDIKIVSFLIINLLIIATYFTGHIIGFMTRNIINKNKLKIDGLKDGGKLIGNLERALIFFLVLFNMSSVIGLIATAKSILRFGEIKQNWKTAEYILIGTLTSFLVAIVLGYIARFIIIRTIPYILN